MLRCNRGVSVSACKDAQPRIRAAGLQPFYCHDCKAEEVIPRLVMESPESVSESILTDLVGSGAIEAAASQQVRPWLRSVRCRRTQLPVLALCLERGCSSWIDREPSNNCNMVDSELRPRPNGLPALTLEQTVNLYPSRPKEEVYADFRAGRFFMAVLMLPIKEDDVPVRSKGKRSAWIKSFERRFSVSIVTVLRHVEVADLKAALSLTDADLEDVRALSDYD